RGLEALTGGSGLGVAEPARARRAFDSAVRIDPRSADAEAGLGYVALRQKRSEEAAEHFARATHLDPKNAEAWKGLGMARRDQEDRAAARAALTQALALDPADAEAKTLLEQLQGSSEVAEERRRRPAESESAPVRMVSRTG